MDIKFQRKSVAGQPGFGETLKTAREKKRVSLAMAEHETKIRLHYLEAMEEGRFDLVPPSHSKGFIRRYGTYLNIPDDTINQNLEYLTAKLPKKQPFSPNMLKRETRLIVTPKVVTSVLSVLVLIAFVGYIIYQVKQFAAPPALAINRPVGESVVATDTIDVEGKTDPGATVLIDNGSATTKSDGTFSYTIMLRPGLNQITVQSENRIKKSTSKVLSVLYQPPPGATPSPVMTPLVSPSPTPSESPSPSPSPSLAPTLLPGKIPAVKKPTPAAATPKVTPSATPPPSPSPTP